MARKTNTEIRQTSIKPVEQYAFDHPTENRNIAKQFAKSSIKCTKIQIQYTRH